MKQFLSFKKLALVLFFITLSGVIISGCGKKIQNSEIDTASTDAISFQEQMLTLYEAKTPYIGNASAVGNIIGQLPFVKAEQMGMELQTETEPFGVTVKYKDLSEVLEQELKSNAYLMFCLIDNLGRITFSDDFKTTVCYSRNDVLEYGNSAEVFSENEETFAAFATQLQNGI